MFKKILIAIACASLLAFAADDPVSVVKSKDAELQNIIKKSKRTAKETERVKSLLNDSFDFALLAKKSLAASDWKAQDEAYGRCSRCRSLVEQGQGIGARIQDDACEWQVEGLGLGHR